METCWKPHHQWDHPEIDAAMQKLCDDGIEEQAAVERLMKASTKLDIIVASRTLALTTLLLLWFKIMGDTPILIFVEGVG
jgi:hypothetical protein